MTTKANQTYQRKFDFSAGSTTPSIARLALKTTQPEVKAVAPRVFYLPEVYDVIKFLVAYCKKEVGWLGMVEQIGNDYVVTEVFVPEQIVHGAETDIDAEAMAALVMELLDANKDSSKLYYWGHSHVDMGVTPSGQDETQIDEYLVDCPKFIRGIYNKRGDTKVDVFHRDDGVVWQCVENRIWSPGLSKEQYEQWKALVDENVTEYVYQPSWHGRSWQPQGTPGLGGGAQMPTVAHNNGRRGGKRLGNGAWVMDDEDDALSNHGYTPPPRNEAGVVGYDDLYMGSDYL